MSLKRDVCVCVFVCVCKEAGVRDQKITRLPAHVVQFKKEHIS